MNSDLYNESHRATYCPEDDKLRLYVGRVPRDQYEALRADGWTSTPKQSEAGQGEFAATWTPKRRDTALAYAGIIEDEDAGPEERAADRAERFGGYLDKRLDEATGHADRYDAGPEAHGYQSEKRAERAAARHDRIAERAGDAWSKAEYWQRRTAGVIAHALYSSRPDVRMGRIKVLEAELRRLHEGSEWHAHIALRIAYENQMLEAQGGRLASVEIEVGGRLGSKLIVKVNKSNATGRVTSVSIIGSRVDGWAYRVSNIPGTEFAEYQMETERLPPGAYTPPDDASRAELKALKALIKTSAPKKDACPLINPTKEDAERLQAIWNANAMAECVASYKRQFYSLPVDDCAPSTVLYMTQAEYSAKSKGTYCIAGTRGVFASGIECANYYGDAQRLRKQHGREVCMVRRMSGHYQGGREFQGSASRVIVITDKPQKPLPAAVWATVTPNVTAVTPEVTTANA